MTCMQLVGSLVRNKNEKVAATHKAAGIRVIMPA